MKKNFFNLQRFAKKIKLTNQADAYANSVANRIIYALGGNDTVQNYAEKITIFGGKGNDTIQTYKNNVKIFGDTGKDYIENYEADNVTLNGGKSDDQIKTWWSDSVTITGGKGNDSIQLGAFESIEAESAKNTVIKYAEGDGNDTIFGFDSNDTLYITKGNYSTSVKGNNFIVTVGKQKIILKDAAPIDNQKIIIKNPSGELDIYNDWSVRTANSSGETITANNVTIKSAKSGSYIVNWGDNVKVIGNNGFDEISNMGNNVKIFGGKGRDSIMCAGNFCSISGGAGNDDIGYAAIGNYVTINGGKGNDYMNMVDYYDKNLGISHTSYKTVVQYAKGDGNDTINGFNSDDTLQITSGNYSASVNSENDIIFKIGKGSITLRNAAGQNIFITDSKGETTKKFFPTVDSSSSLWTDNNFLKEDNLSAIVENNIGLVGEFETKNFDSFKAVDANFSLSQSNIFGKCTE